MAQRLLSALGGSHYLAMLKIIRRLAGSVKRWIFPPIDYYLASCSGVIHVGANSGQERDFYARHRLSVVWIEPLNDQFDALTSNIRGLANQVAIRALITDRDNDVHILHVSNNAGMSSSIFELHLHKDIWPNVHYVNDVEMKSSTLPTALNTAGIDCAKFDALVLDTQGSELLVLRGAAPILGQFKFVKTEAADFESYKGCATVSEISRFLAKHNFTLHKKELMARHPAGGRYFELLFKHN
jgi:FkbM family methyltransferase